MDTSCIMLACNLLTPVSLGSVFQDGDLTREGVISDSHITLLYAKGKILEKSDILEAIEPRYIDYLDNLKESEKYFDALELFSLSYFKGDLVDHLILKLKDNTELYGKLNYLHKALAEHFDIPDEKDFIPHLTLADVQEGLGEKYTKDEVLLGILKGSAFQPEDFIVSFGSDSNQMEKWKTHDLTHFNSVDRFFRERDLRDELNELLG